MREEFEGIVKRLDSVKRELNKKEKLADRKIMDVLHKIEISNFNACDGYIYAKMIKDIREERRAIKNEYEAVSIAINELSKDVKDNTGKTYRVRELINEFGKTIKQK